MEKTIERMINPMRILPSKRKDFLILPSLASASFLLSLTSLYVETNPAYLARATLSYISKKSFFCYS